MDQLLAGLRQIAELVGGIAVVSVATLVTLLAAQELLRRLRHFETHKAPRPLSRLGLFGQSIQWAEASKDGLDALNEQVQKQQEVITSSADQLAILSLRVTKLEQRRIREGSE